ncbi:hypothetical protein [Streptomyces sp. NPDC037389]|uniref:hypothetical protein n=1 Tax=Streptomyces sp. NPDC037389 TaxID=3155369 RepID=UPI0034079DB9
MAIKDQAEVLWAAWIGKLPRTVRERVELLGGSTEAARAAGVSPGTVRRWVREEERAIPTTMAMAIETMGGVEEAARAAGVRPRTVKEWLRKERRGAEVGKRQAKHMAKLTTAATDKYLAARKPQGNQQTLHKAVMTSPRARQQAMSTRRAARMSTSGAHLSISAQVAVDTGRRQDVRWREIDLNFRGNIMQAPTQEFLKGRDKEAIDKLSDAFGSHYAVGTGWHFREIRSMRIREFGAGHGQTFG